MTRRHSGSGGVSRRRFLTASASAAAGAAAINVLANPAYAVGATQPAGQPTVPPGQLGLQLFSVRDVITRAPDPANGVNAGFDYCFEQLAQRGYQQVEFAGYTQSTQILGRQITPQEIRKALDDNGLIANGSHITFSDSTIEQQLDIAETLGMPFLGTANIPTGSRFKKDWARAAEDFNRWGAIAKSRGIKLYQHNHHAEYNFLLDAGPTDTNGNPTRSTGMRGLEYFFTQVDPKLVWFEMDIFWGFVAQHRYQTFVDPSGSQRTEIFDPLATVTARSQQFLLFHVKDGVPANNDDGFDMVPAGDGTIPLREFLNAAGPDHRPNWEQDNAPGADPNQSLAISKISADNMLSWRHDRKGMS